MSFNDYIYWQTLQETGKTPEEIYEYEHPEVVRCKECKYEPICSHSVQHTTHEPTTVTIGYKSVDFCSYGEREDE